MRQVKLALITGASFMLFGCNGTKINDYQGTAPEMHFDKFFAGPVKGTGIVQDRGGKIIKRFDVDMFGAWQGNDFTLAEHFVYYDGKVIDRAWHIQKTAANRYIGRADDIVGDAPGEEQGTAINWHYVMKVPTDSGKVYNVSFDDWLYQMHDDTVINRNNMSKFGIKIGTLTATMRKQSPGTHNLAEGLIGKK